MGLDFDKKPEVEQNPFQEPAKTMSKEEFELRKSALDTLCNCLENYINHILEDGSDSDDVDMVNNLVDKIMLIVIDKTE